jgi:NodT family efflux transporter outer membrane factor (OMF) lipoprotein
MKVSRLVALAIGPLLLSACAVGPDFQSPQSTLPSQWQAAGSGISTEAVDTEWWKRLNDPVLDDLVGRALQSNADVKLAILRVAESRAQFGATAGARWPSVNASGSYSRERQSETGVSTRLIGVVAPAAQREQIISVLSEPFDVFQVGFDAGWEIDLWGRVRRSLESADAALRVSDEDLHDAQLSLVAEVVRTYLELRGVQDQLRIAQADVDLSTDMLELTEYRVKGGIVDELDSSTQRARLADTRATLPELQQREVQIRSALELLLNVEPGSLSPQVTTTTAKLAIPTAIAGGVPSEVARRRPDIRRAEARLHEATAEIGVAVADLYPRITLTGSFVQQSLRASDLSEWGARQWSVGPSISLPIFDGSRRRSVVEIRKLQQQEAAVNYQRTVLRAWHEIENALSAYSAEQRRNQELAVALAASREAYEIANVRYRHGLVDFLIELDAHRTLLQVERAYADSNTQIGTRLVAVYKSLGGGWAQ